MSLYKLDSSAVSIGKAEDKHSIMQQLTTLFSDTYGLDRAMVLEGMEEREKLGSTGFGRGVAIPHARIDGLNRPISALIRLSEPVDFAAADALPVELVFGLLSPTNAGASHLQALAAISRLVREDKMVEAMLSAPDAEALYALIANVADRDAA